MLSPMFHFNSNRILFISKLTQFPFRQYHKHSIHRSTFIFDSPLVLQFFFFKQRVLDCSCHFIHFITCPFAASTGFRTFFSFFSNKWNMNPLIKVVFNDSLIYLLRNHILKHALFSHFISFSSVVSLAVSNCSCTFDIHQIIGVPGPVPVTARSKA